MGNIVGGMSWNRRPDVDGVVIVRRLDEIRKRWGLNLSDGFFAPQTGPDENAYSVGLGGELLCPQNPEARVKAFLFDAAELLKKENIDTRVWYEKLPM